MGFWEGFSDSFFREADRAVQRERQRQLDEQNRQRFEWEKEQQAYLTQLRDSQKQLAYALQHGVVDTSLVPTSPQATGLRVPRVEETARPDPQATDFTVPSAGELVPTSPQATGLRVPRSTEMPRPDPQVGDATAGPALLGVARRGLTPEEVADRVASLVAMSGDYAGVFSAQDRAAQARLKKARQAEYERLQGMTDEELAQLSKGIIAGISGVSAMMDFDPKTRNYLLVSQVPGVPSQTLSRAELLQGLMSVWEAGNGDYAQGIKAQIELAQTLRNLRNQDFERSVALARANADAYFRGLAADNDAARTSLAHQELGLRREQNNLEKNPLKQRIQTLEATLGRKLTEKEVLALGGLKADNTALAFNETDGGVVFTDGRTGLPVGKLDSQLGIVPYGNDPRNDPRLLRTLQEKNIRIATGQTQDGLPTWVYITPSGRRFTTPEEAINPPIRQSDVQDLSGLKQLLEQTRAQLIAAGKSGDQRAIQFWAQRAQGLEQTLRAAAHERFGERAPEYLSAN